MSAPSALAGRAAVVTGGSRGIGAAIAGALVARGADVLVCGRSAEALARSRDAAGSGGAGTEVAGRLETLQADVRDAAQAGLLVDRAAALFGGLDILVNNAGVSRFGELAAQSDDDWRRSSRPTSAGSSTAAGPRFRPCAAAAAAG